MQILYVSIVSPYKHQWHVADAVAHLRREGLPVVLNLVGPSDNSLARKQLMNTIGRVNPDGNFIKYHGSIPFAELHDYYAQADLCLFASSCENLPNILLEGMASGVPVVSSNRGPMPEVLGDGGVYFDPENFKEIAQSIKKIFDNPELAYQLACKSYKKAEKYSWEQCAKETFSFLAHIAQKPTKIP